MIPKAKQITASAFIAVALSFGILSSSPVAADDTSVAAVTNSGTGTISVANPVFTAPSWGNGIEIEGQGFPTSTQVTLKLNLSFESGPWTIVYSDSAVTSETGSLVFTLQPTSPSVILASSNPYRYAVDYSYTVDGLSYSAAEPIQLTVLPPSETVATEPQVPSGPPATPVEPTPPSTTPEPPEANPASPLPTSPETAAPVSPSIVGPSGVNSRELSAGEELLIAGFQPEEQITFVVEGEMNGKWVELGRTIKNANSAGEGILNVKASYPDGSDVPNGMKLRVTGAGTNSKEPAVHEFFTNGVTPPQVQINPTPPTATLSTNTMSNLAGDDENSSALETIAGLGLVLLVAGASGTVYYRYRGKSESN